MIRGVVPAAGRSARMGSPKALLDADGRTFVDCVVAALLQGGCDEVCVVVREDPGPVAAAARRAGARVCVNPAPDNPEAGGQLSSVRVAASEPSPTPPEAIVILPIDHPLVAAGTVARMIEVFRESGAQAVLPTLDGRRGHPVLLSSELLPRLADTGLTEGVRTLLSELGEGRVEVAVDDGGILHDIDTLSDYRRAFPRAWRRRFHSR